MLHSNALVPAPIARLPWRPILLVCAIGSFGAINLYSIAGGSWTPWALPHIVRVVVLLGMAIFISTFRPQFFRDLAFPCYAVLLVLLIVVFFVGVVRGGARSWLNLGIMGIQPSELMKPVLVLVLASFYAHLPANQTRKFSAIWPAALLLLIPFALILIQPDLGTALLLVFSAVTIMFLAGLPIRLFVIGAVITAAAIPIVYNYVLMPHQQRRVSIFLNPEQDPLGGGYHITQSKIAVGSGGLFGKGFLNGSQSQLQYLPEPQTDFIFPAMVEEWGLIGGIWLMFCFGLLFRWGMGVALEAKDRFSQLTASGLTMTIFFYFIINMLMVMGLAPVVGIPLPLFSHGGSAMLTVMLCLGMLMAIDRQNRGVSH